MQYLLTRQKLTVAVTVLALAGVCVSESLAQTTTSGLFGSSRTVGGATGTAAGTRTNLGTGGTIAGATQTDTAAGTITGDERFSRQSAAGQFVGADSADMANILGTAMGTQFQELQLNNLNQNSQDVNTGGDEMAAFRIRYQLGFQTPRIPTLVIADRLARPFESARFINADGSGVATRIVGSRVVLEGKVATIADRKLAERMALLEPGVWEVENRLEVIDSEAAVDHSGTSTSSNLRTQGQTPQMNQVPPAAGSAEAGSAGGLPEGLVPTFSRQRFPR